MSEIEITVKVKDAAQAAAEVAAVGEAAKKVGTSGGELGGVSKGIDDIGHSAEDTAGKIKLTQDAQGRWRNEIGQFASDAEKAAAGVEDVGRKSESSGRSASSAGVNFAFLHSKTVLLAGAALTLGPALAAIPAMAVGAAAGVGTLAGAFSGVIGALKDYAAQQSSAAQSGASAAATAFSNSVAIKGGEQAIADAKKAAAQAAVSSAAQIASAQQAVGDAERQAAQSAQSASDAIVAAQQRVEQATYAVGQAQAAETNAEHAALLAREALTQAEHDATNQLADLNNAMKDSHLQVEQATLNVAIAEKTLHAAQSNSLLTTDQKTAADLSYRQALQSLADAKQHDLEATQKADQANKQGADGLSSVTSAQYAAQQAADAVANAQHGVTAAAQAQGDAQHALAVAQQHASDQQIASNEAVAKAQKALADAFSAAGKQQADSAETVRRAEQALADMQHQQALAADAAGASNNKFADDMKKLTQPGRDFVNQVLGMKDGLHDLSATAQTATLPGFTQMLKDSGGMLPTAKQGIKDMGSAFSDTAIHAGDLMKSPVFQGNMSKILKEAAQFAQQIGSGVVDMVGGVADAGAKAAPIVKGLGQGFQDILKTGIPDFFRALTQHAQSSGDNLHSILDIVSNLMGPLGTISSSLSAALAPALQVLASPSVKESLQKIADALGSILITLSPVITAFAKGLAGALQVVGPLLQDVAKFLQDNHKWTVPLAGILLGIAAAWWLVNAAMAANPIFIVIGLVAGLVIGLIECWEKFKGFRDFVKQMWADIKQWFMDGVHAVEGFFLHTIPDAAKKGWQLVYDWTVKPVKDAFDWITGKDGFGKVTDFFGRVPGDLAKVGHGMWDWIKDSFKTAINMIIGWWNDLSFTTPHFHVPGIGDTPSVTIGMPHISPLKAAGGVASGLIGINEAGIEMVRVPTGSTVMPHANTMSALAGGRGGGGTLQIEWVGGQGGDPLIEWIRHNIRIRGGNGPNSVQNVLGQS